MIIRLSHPWKYHHTLDLLDTETGDLSERDAKRLIRAGYAVDVENLLVPGAGGWYVVPLSDGTETKVQGRDAALAAMREDSRP